MRTRIAQHLWAKLWEDYRRRVSYAQVYEQMIRQAGGTVANDHIAFRSLRLDLSGNTGISYLGRIAEALGYIVAGEYTFAEQQLYARYYRHPEQERASLPKLFISELAVDALPEATAQLITQTIRSKDSSSLLNLQCLESWMNSVDTESAAEAIASQLQAVFIRPWVPPQRSVVEAVNRISQYGAWVLLHGYAVNHFTGYVNCQNTPCYLDIEHTAYGLAKQGVPMKAKIEGSRGSGLRQTATQAVTELVSVRDDTSGKLIQIPWTYAYYEIAERFPVEGASGEHALFEGFLGSQAQHLFEMTRKGGQVGK